MQFLTALEKYWRLLSEIVTIVLTSLPTGWWCRSYSLYGRLLWLGIAESLWLTVRSFKMFPRPTGEGRDTSQCRWKEYILLKSLLSRSWGLLIYKNKVFFAMWIWGRGLPNISKAKIQVLPLMNCPTSGWRHYPQPLFPRATLIMLILVKFGATDCFGVFINYSAGRSSLLICG